MRERERERERETLRKTGMSTYHDTVKNDSMGDKQL